MLCIPIHIACTADRISRVMLLVRLGLRLVWLTVRDKIRNAHDVYSASTFALFIRIYVLRYRVLLTLTPVTDLHRERVTKPDRQIDIFDRFVFSKCQITARSQDAGSNRLRIQVVTRVIRRNRMISLAHRQCGGCASSALSTLPPPTVVEPAAAAAAAAAAAS